MGGVAEGTVAREAGDGNNRQASAGGHAGRGRPGPRLQAITHRPTPEAQVRHGSGGFLTGTNDSALTPCHVFHLSTACSVLEQSPLLHPTTAAPAALSPGKMPPHCRRRGV